MDILAPTYAAFSPPGNRELVATTGFFDGVHLGHFAVLRRVLELAREQGKDSAVVTFWPHPRVILHQDSNKVRLLHSLDEKKQRLQRLGIDHVLVLPFTPAFAQLSPAQFVKEYLHRQFRITTLVAGYDHHLGANAGADYEQLRQIGKAINMAVEYVGEIKDDTGQVTVSSTKIREALAQGDTGAANQ
ncbi:MAG: FAD synthetase family protein, partial [Prevotellaceae bacterium]|nr:FAD synthetase family protein [Prevotellaceae bacterium]